MRPIHINEWAKLRNYNLVKVEFIAELLYWIAVDFTGVLNEVASECICCNLSYCYNFYISLLDLY